MLEMEAKRSDPPAPSPKKGIFNIHMEMKDHFDLERSIPVNLFKSDLSPEEP